MYKVESMVFRINNMVHNIYNSKLMRPTDRKFKIITQIIYMVSPVHELWYKLNIYIVNLLVCFTLKIQYYSQSFKAD